jgi:hypothetical protein
MRPPPPRDGNGPDPEELGGAFGKEGGEAVAKGQAGRRVSGYNPAEGICWQFQNRGDRFFERNHRDKCPACSPRAPDRILAMFGRCRTGKRWFWHAHTFGFGREEPKEECGSVDTEGQAWGAAMDAVRRFRDGRPVTAIVRHGHAGDHLKKLNEAERRARPAPDTKEANTVEYLFSSYYYCDEMSPPETLFYRWRILKKTKKRVYYVRADRPERIDERGELIGEPRSPSSYDTTGFVDREKLEADGEVRNRGVHWSSHDSRLYVSLERLLEERPRQAEPPNLQQLKAEMAAAHPDRGGSSAAFIEARARYVAALREMQRADHG